MSDEKIVQAEDLFPPNRLALTDVLKELQVVFGLSKSTFPIVNTSLKKEIDDLEEFILEIQK